MPDSTTRGRLATPSRPDTIHTREVGRLSASKKRAATRRETMRRNSEKPSWLCLTLTSIHTARKLPSGRAAIATSCAS